jgi:uncharacterized protein YecE (DUF72 family)
MQFSVGTSGYSYPGWKGSFYPAALPQKDMLPYYSQRFSTVELNNTFYRMPGEATITSWMGQVPDAFRFAVKVPQTITHRKRLKGIGPDVEHLFSALSALKHRLGPLLFQLPPNFKKDLPRLIECLGLIGDRTAAFEFRHDSWFDDEVFESLHAHGCALCIADVEESDTSAKLTATAKWGYVRLRRETYTDRELRQWIDRLRCQKWDRVYVYFKHDDVGNGARLAARFLEFIDD